jgi:hypothetical protein
MAFLLTTIFTNRMLVMVEKNNTNNSAEQNSFDFFDKS